MKITRVTRLISVLLSLLMTLVAALVVLLMVSRSNPGLFEQNTINTANWRPKDISTDLPAGAAGKQIKYGYALVTESPKWMGPQVINPTNKFSGNNLSCKNCHLKAGTQPGSGSFVGVAKRFPQFRGRENKIGTLKERVNGCMERSMNGRKLPEDSKQMEAIIAYIEWLSEDVPEEKLAEYKGYPKINLPLIAADPEKGKPLYTKHCQLCHGAEGKGVWLSDRSKGYQFPPLWGTDTYNHGAGMHRVITAAEFIKSNMPFEQATWDKPLLTDEEAYHIAAYINSFDRPQKNNTEADFPDKKLKPVSTPYGPWVDDFPPLAHKYGPFQPIMAFYEDKYDIKKSK